MTRGASRPTSSRPGPLRWVYPLMALSVAVPVSAAEVVPGGVVRWPGDGVIECEQEGRRWEPIDGQCWFPIDLLEPQGELEVARWLAHGTRETTRVVVGAYPYESQYITLQDDSKVELSAADLERVESENRQIAALWTLETERRFVLPLGPPLAELPEGRRFGARRFFNNRPRSPHTGVDYRADAGTPILAGAAGTVVLAGDFFFSGKSVFIDHGDGLISMYFHLSGFAVETGEAVERGEIIGLVGQSGRATGPHLHYGLRWHGDRVDPGALLREISATPVLR